MTIYIQRLHVYNEIIITSFSLMFWTDWTDDRSNLWRANMDGSEPTSLASGGREYYRLTIDYQGEGRSYFY